MKNSNRSFGIVFFIFFLLLGIYPIINDHNVNYYLIFIALVFLILGILNSKILTPLKKIWIKLGDILGKIVSPVIMFLLFMTIVLLTGLILRLFGKDIINLKMSKKTNSYWIKRNSGFESMDNQFL